MTIDQILMTWMLNDGGSPVPMEIVQRDAAEVHRRYSGRTVYNHTLACRSKGCWAGWTEPCNYPDAPEPLSLAIPAPSAPTGQP